MKAHRQILWRQGLFLQPQHLQVQDLVSQGVLTPLYRFALPFFWGVAELSLDEGALGEGALVLKRGTFLFQDGSYCVLHENAVAEGRVLHDAWQGGDGQLTVYLGLRRWNESGANVSLSDTGSLSSLTARSVACREPEEVSDLHAGGPSAAVQRHDFLLKLFWEKEVPAHGDYHLLPLVRVERAGQGARLVHDFVPPLLTVSASPWLMETLSGMTILLRGRLAELERRGAAQKVGALTAADLSLVMTQHSLNRCLPLLTHLAHCAPSHPWQIYLALCQLACELSTFWAEGGAGSGRENPLYDHGDLSRCFGRLRETITTLLETILAAPDETVTLVREGDLFSADLGGINLVQRNRYFLSLRSHCDPLPLLRALQSTVKVSTREHLKVLSAMALPGIGLTHTPVPPHGLSPRLDTFYVELDQHHEQWTAVRAERNLALYWDGSPADLEIALISLADRAPS